MTGKHPKDKNTKNLSGSQAMQVKWNPIRPRFVMLAGASSNMRMRISTIFMFCNHHNSYTPFIAVLSNGRNNVVKCENEQQTCFFLLRPVGSNCILVYHSTNME